MLANQLPAPSVQPDAEAEIRLQVDQELEGESHRSYCFWISVICAVLAVPGIVLLSAMPGSVPPTKRTPAQNKLLPDRSGESEDPRMDIIHIVVNRDVIIRSKSQRQAFLDGVNAFVQKQREFSNENGNIPCEVSLTIYTDGQVEFETVISNEPIAAVRKVTMKDLIQKSLPNIHRSEPKDFANAIFKAIEGVEARSPDEHPTSNRMILITTDHFKPRTTEEVERFKELAALIKAKRALENPYLVQLDILDVRNAADIKKNLGFAGKSTTFFRIMPSMADLKLKLEEHEAAIRPSHQNQMGS